MSTTDVPAHTEPSIATSSNDDTRHRPRYRPTAKPRNEWASTAATIVMKMASAALSTLKTSFKTAPTAIAIGQIAVSLRNGKRFRLDAIQSISSDADRSANRKVHRSSSTCATTAPSDAEVLASSCSSMCDHSPRVPAEPWRPHTLLERLHNARRHLSARRAVNGKPHSSVRPLCSVSSPSALQRVEVNIVQMQRIVRESLCVKALPLLASL